MAGALAPPQGIEHSLGSTPDLVGGAGHLIEVVRVGAVEPLGLEGEESSVAGDHEVVDVAVLQGEAVHPAPDESLPASAPQLAAGVLLTPSSSHVEDR